MGALNFVSCSNCGYHKTWTFGHGMINYAFQRQHELERERRRYTALRKGRYGTKLKNLIRQCERDEKASFYLYLTEEFYSCPSCHYFNSYSNFTLKFKICHRISANASPHFHTVQYKFPKLCPKCKRKGNSISMNPSSHPKFKFYCPRCQSAEHIEISMGLFD